MAKQAGTSTPLNEKPVPDDAFDTWLARGLHKIFDGITSERIPDHLLKLIECDRELHHAGSVDHPAEPSPEPSPGQSATIEVKTGDGTAKPGA